MPSPHPYLTREARALPISSSHGGAAQPGSGAGFVVDIFQEVDEEVRREQLKQLWDRYGILAIAGAVAIVLAVAGWRGYEWWVARQASRFGDAFVAAVALSEQGKHAEAETAFSRLAGEAASGYRVLARMSDAAELAATDPKAAVAAYDTVAADSSVGQPVRDLAAIRAALLLIDAAPLSEMTARLEGLAGPEATFRHTARELLALSAWRAGDMPTARRWIDMIMSDGDTPQSVRRRVEVLMALVPANSRS